MSAQIGIRGIMITRIGLIRTSSRRIRVFEESKRRRWWMLLLFHCLVFFVVSSTFIDADLFLAFFSFLAQHA